MRPFLRALGPRAAKDFEEQEQEQAQKVPLKSCEAGGNGPGDSKVRLGVTPGFRL